MACWELGVMVSEPLEEQTTVWWDKSHMAVSSPQHKDLSALDSLSVPAQVCTETVLERCVYPINAQLTETLL